MKIKSLKASFGKLSDDKLELEDGLNIIQAPNEAGKSTWCAFIRAMLYGINTSERDKNGFLSDKTKYRPWNGNNMSGTMEIRHGGYDITLQRTSLASAPMKKLSAFYSDILLPVENLSADTAGEVLTGATDKVFDRTALIRQNSVAVSEDPSLEKRIASLISTGEEQTSYTEADAKLRVHLRKLRHNRTGTLPKLENELADEEAKLLRMDKLCDELALINQDKEKFNERSKQLASDLESYKKLEHIELSMKAANAKKRALEAGAHVEQLREALTKNGLIMNTDDVSEIASLYSLYTAADNTADKAFEKQNISNEAMKKTDNEKTSSIFKAFSDTEALAKAQAAVKINAEKQTLENKISSVFHKIYIISAVLFLTTAGYFMYSSMYIYGILAGVLGLAFILMFLLPIIKKSAISRQLYKILSEFPVSSVDELQCKAQNYSDVYKLAERLKFDCESSAEAYNKAFAEAENAKGILMNRVHDFFPEINDPAEIGPALSALAEPMKKLPQAELEQAKALAEASVLVSSSPVEITDEPLAEYIPVPPRSLEDTRKAYAHTNEHIAELNNRNSMLQGELNALGDPIATIAHINELKDEINAQKSEYDALTLAIDTLSYAHMELQTKFSPLVNNAAGEIMKQLSSGKYEKLVFDKNFNALASIKGESVSHDILSLSTGTADQIYLALRLAMVQLLLSSDEPCPIILDDVLSNFDDTRAKNALQYLYGLSKDRQVILFTCHSRETLMLSDCSDINVIKL